MSRELKITVITTLAVMAAFATVHFCVLRGDASDHVLRVGFIYDSDESTPYTANFIRAQHAVEQQFDGQVEVLARSNVSYGTAARELEELAEAGCGIIFTTSYGYSADAKACAGRHPEVQFCQATGDNANAAPVLPNYHTFMGEIYEGRYVAGLVAGMKLQELVRNGRISARDARVGYVAAHPVAEVISGYTAFLLGVRAVVPEATMTVRYTGTWGSYSKEKACARRLIEEGCVIISQHSDTFGPAVACEAVAGNRPVFHVGYNQSMIGVAPTTSLVSTRINWAPYITGAVQAALAGRPIERQVRGHVHGNDVGAGFEADWVQVLELNHVTVAPGTAERVAEAVQAFRRGGVRVFWGDYVGVSVDNPRDVYDLRGGYEENASASAPSFRYVLRDVIRVAE